MYITIIYNEHWCLIAGQQIDSRNESVRVQEGKRRGAIDEPKGLRPVAGVLVGLIIPVVVLDLVGEAILAAEARCVGSSSSAS